MHGLGTSNVYISSVLMYSKAVSYCLLFLVITDSNLLSTSRIIALLDLEPKPKFGTLLGYIEVDTFSWTLFPPCNPELKQKKCSHRHTLGREVSVYIITEKRNTGRCHGKIQPRKTHFQWPIPISVHVQWTSSHASDHISVFYIVAWNYLINLLLSSMALISQVRTQKEGLSGS